jgi:rubrerythrin
MRILHTTGGFMKTAENLEAAFAGESKAYMSYQFYALKAEKEGYKQVAKLFRAIAEAEKIHALSHFAVMEKAGDTAVNIGLAIEGETYEFKEMYPAFIEQAKADSYTRANISFSNASAVEKVHSVLYAEALKNLGKNEQTDYYICPVCGNTVPGGAPDKCEICGVSGGKFMLVK